MRGPTWRQVVQTISLLAACALLTAHPGAQREHRGGDRFSVETLSKTPVPRELQGLTDPALVGAIDLHFHVGPDSYPRSIDAIDAAKLAKERGMRGAVLKHHYSQTAGLAYFARKYVPGFEAFGGIALNTPVGGLNVEALRHMIEIEGGWGKVVWMPTHDSVAEGLAEKRPFVRVANDDGRLVPEVKDIIALVAKNQLLLETGHSKPEEALAIIQEARSQGVRHILVTHEGGMTLAQTHEATRMGALIEFVTLGIAGDAEKMRAKAEKIRQVGPQFAVISSDSGLLGAPLHPDGLAAFAKALRAAGFSERELDGMYKDNPATLLGLPPWTKS